MRNKTKGQLIHFIVFISVIGWAVYCHGGLETIKVFATVFIVAIALSIPLGYAEYLIDKDKNSKP